MSVFALDGKSMWGVVCQSKRFSVDCDEHSDDSWFWYLLLPSTNVGWIECRRRSSFDGL